MSPFGGGAAVVPDDAILVTDSSGAIIPGTLTVTSYYRVPNAMQLAWWPDAPLAPLAPYTVNVHLPNARSAACGESPPVDRTFEITTRAELTPPPPAPPLEGVGYGDAWLPGATTPQGCCIPLDTSRCTNPGLCFECWDAVRTRILVPDWGELPTSSDPLVFFLFYGVVTAFDMSAYLTQSTGRPPLLLLRPGMGPIPTSPAAHEVCLTAMTRNWRTGQETYLTQCTPVDDSGASLIGLELPAAATLDPPSDPTLELAPADCNAEGPQALASSDVLVARWYTSVPNDCAPACGGMFDASLWNLDGTPRPPGTPRTPGAIGTPPSSTTNPPLQAPSSRPATTTRDASGCSARPIGTSPPSAALALLLIAAFCLRRVRRSRRPARQVRSTTFESRGAWC